MLHELFMALAGYPGNIFVMKSAEIKVVADLPFLSKEEENLLNQLLKLGSQYCAFNSFISEHSCCPALKEDDCFKSGLKPGLYLTAFCDGLLQTLAPYKQKLLELEQKILTDAHLTVMYISSELQQFRYLFVALTGLLEQITVKKSHGCQILDVIYKNSQTGLTSVKDALNELLYYCHGVMYKQLSIWMLQGVLLDQHHEFFIQHETPTAVAMAMADDDDLGIGGITGRQLQEIIMQSSMYEPSIPNKREEFSIRSDMFPSYIPLSLGEKILFVGESVQMFEQKHEITSFMHYNSVLRENEEKFAKEIYNLSKHREFDLQNFEEVVGKVRMCVAERLWHMVLEENHLYTHLQVMKDMYLLGRGELFLAFIDTCNERQLLNHPPNANTQHDVNFAFHQAARMVLQVEDDQLFQAFQLTINSNKILSKKPSRTDSVINGWSALGLTCTVEWPLHLLFTNSTLDKYNKLFRFLLTLKRVQLRLQNCWAEQMQNKQSLNEEQARLKWLLRYHMAYLLDNLQYYLQVDVIESQYSILLGKIEATHDFEAIRLAHDQFLAALLVQSFLHMKTVSRYLKEILEICNNFCVLMQGEAPSQEAETNKLEELSKSFQVQSGLLFRILSSVQSHQSSPHLAQLLLRMDFNKFFSMAGGQLGSYSASTDKQPSSSRR
ncbi:gamma-tubulin complex component 4-like [Tubulanus polymorphus]|uniref:gamma-tubulin complex component 4-like n=1 Tax=Tubulanus polymorphus TaxID=672921 RepID=UPI003DA4EFDE